MKQNSRRVVNLPRSLPFLSIVLALLFLNWERPLLLVISLTTLLWIFLLKEKSLAGLFIILSIPLLYHPKFLDTITTIRNISASVYENKRKIVEEVFQPNSGIDVLPSQYMPAEVKEIREMVQANQLPDFNLLGQLREDPLKLQRAIEVNWPVKMESDSKYQFYLIEDTERLDFISLCQKIDQKGEVILVFCP